ncbi:hypothetical protein HMSSN036_14240 [Paenibacillus macerans]|nr:hypothetical protein HMSSN036_14240 [Paenibacillus macerans]
MSTKNSALTTMVRGNIGIIFVLLVLCVILSIVSPVFLTTENLITVLRQVSNNVFLALGMTLVMILGGIDLSVGAIVAVSGTLTVGFMVNNGIPMPVAILLGILIGTLLGFFNGVIITNLNCLHLS